MRLRPWILIPVITLMLVDGWLRPAAAMAAQRPGRDPVVAAAMPRP
jgi:hypothetical protein